MGAMPIEPSAFAARVAELIRRLQPSYDIDLVNPGELLVNGRRLDLNNLLRMVANEPERGGDIVEHFIDQLFASDTVNSADLPLELARDRIMPRVQPESVFQHLSRELVAHVPFVNDTVVVFVIDLPHMTVSITTDQAVRWGLSFDELDMIARENLDQYTDELEVQIIESREGGRAAIIAEQDGYDAARLLMGDLHRRLAPKLGREFLVATPARDMFIAMSAGPEPFVDRLMDRVREDYARLPYPISPDPFLVTMDGVAGTIGRMAA